MPFNVGDRVNVDLSYRNWAAPGSPLVERFSEGEILEFQPYSNDYDEDDNPIEVDNDYPYYIRLLNPPDGWDDHDWFEKRQLTFLGERPKKQITGLAKFLKEHEEDAS